MADDLAIWLYGDRVATIALRRGRAQLQYTPEALARHALGTPLLSLSLPLAPRRYTQSLIRPFLDGLLPEGEPRRAIARDVGVRADDTFALLRELGRDCAGAIVVQPVEEPGPPPASTLTAEPLSEQDIYELVVNLRSAPLGAGGRVRISLAGIQEKLLLTRMPDGRWGRPVDGTPSTHILKPEIAAFPRTVENEAFCMRVARHLGLDAAPIETIEIAGRKLIVVERYDRTVRADGGVERVHQEDFCQASGLPPEVKYEEDGGPTLRRIAGILQAVAAAESLERLLQAATLNVALGNGDAHAKNLSLLHPACGIPTLAPLYDLMCTLHYGDERLAMCIDSLARTEQVTAPALLNEAARWGISRSRALALVEGLLERLPAAVASAAEETPGVPAKLVALVTRSGTRLRRSLLDAR